jgi:hypothetical protein
MGVILTDQHELPFRTFEEELIDPLFGHELSDVEKYVANLLLDATTEKPIRMAEVMASRIERSAHRPFRSASENDRSQPPSGSRIPDLQSQSKTGRVLVGTHRGRARGIHQGLASPVQRRDQNALRDHASQFSKAGRPAEI